MSNLLNESMMIQGKFNLSLKQYIALQNMRVVRLVNTKLLI